MSTAPKKFGIHIEMSSDPVASDIGKYLAGGGVSGVIVASLYLVYKCCNRRQFTSKCCGGEMTVGNNEPSAQVVVMQASPHVAPLDSRRASQQIPELVLEPRTENVEHDEK